MILVVGFVLSTLLLLVSFVQLLALEDMRLRSRDSEALEYFKQHLQDKLRAASERDALAYSLAKHTLLVCAGSSFGILALVGGGGRAAPGQSLLVARGVIVLFYSLGPPNL